MGIHYKPYSKDKENLRNPNICACGKRLRFSEELETGYCNDCLKKKKDFINKITKKMNFRGNNVFVSYVRRLEEIRVSLCEEKISDMIDEYYGNTLPDNRFCEPYEDPMFIYFAYYAKSDISMKIVDSVSSESINKIAHPFQAKANRYLDEYIDKLKNMVKSDFEATRSSGKVISEHLDNFNNWKKTKKIH